MKIYNKIVIDMNTYEVLYEDSYEYNGLISKCGSSKEDMIDTKFRKSNKEEIIGLPPAAWDNESGKIDKWVVSSMPVIRIVPAWPSTAGEGSKGLHLFSLDQNKGLEKWLKLVNESVTDTELSQTYKLDKLKDRYIDIAYLHETTVSETFSQEYGASKFEEFANLPSSTFRELRQITGSDNAKDTFKELGEKVNVPGLSQLFSGMGWAAGKGEKMLESLGGGAMAKLLLGSKVDFPSIWKGSSFAASHSVTCRLYNPDPTSKEAFMDRIAWPLIKILGLVVPISDRVGKGKNSKEALTYHSPVLCSAKCEGLWEIRAGFVSSVEVVKGGEANDISFKQHPGMIDVRISFGELYNVITTYDGGQSNRPTFKKYINNLLANTEIGSESKEDFGVNLYEIEGDTIAWNEPYFPAMPSNTTVANAPIDTPGRVDPQLTEQNNNLLAKGLVPEAQTTVNQTGEDLKESADNNSTTTNDALGNETSMASSISSVLTKDVQNDIYEGTDIPDWTKDQIGTA